MTPQPGTAGTGDDPLAPLVTQELTVNGQTVTRLVGLAFDSADQTDGVLRFDGTGSTNGITDGSAKVLVNGTVHDVAGAEWVDLSGTKHTVGSWEKVINSQFDVTITDVSPDPVAPGNTLDVTVDVTNSGTGQDTQTVTLDINNSVGQVDSTSVTLSGGGSTTQTLSWAVPSGQTEQDYTATVSSADDTASQTVTVGSFTTSMFQNPIQQYSAAVYGGADGDSPFALPEVVTGSSASAVGSPTFRANQSGFAAAEYDGSNDGHNGLTANLPTGGVQVSFAALVYADSVHTGRLFTYGDDNAGGRRAIVSVRDGRGIEATVFGSSYSFARGGTYPTGQWITVGASFDTDTATAYLNGSSVATDVGSTYNVSDTESRIGYTDYAIPFFFDGYIAEVVVSSAAEPDQTFTDYHNDRI